MITVVVRTKLAGTAQRCEVMALFREMLPNYQGVEGLLRKSFIFDEVAGVAGGIYLWVNRELAEAFFSQAWREQMVAQYRAEPDVMFFETPIIVDNEADEVLFVAA